MKILNSENNNFYSELDKIINKRNKIDKATLKTVEKIINNVRKNKELIIELMAIDYLKNNNDYEINLMFKNNAHITLVVEALEILLEDQNEIKN